MEPQKFVAPDSADRRLCERGGDAMLIGGKDRTGSGGDTIDREALRNRGVGLRPPALAEG